MASKKKKKSVPKQANDKYNGSSSDERESDLSLHDSSDKTTDDDDEASNEHKNLKKVTKNLPLYKHQQALELSACISFKFAKNEVFSARLANLALS